MCIKQVIFVNFNLFFLLIAPFRFGYFQDYKIRFADSLPTAMQLKSLPTAVQLGKFTDTQFVKRKIHRQK